jgi:proline iminopeptidase
MSRTLKIAASAALLLVTGCRRAEDAANAATPPASYYDNNGHPDGWAGGERKITISTPKGPHQIWIKRIGNNPKLKLLLRT